MSATASDTPRRHPDSMPTRAILRAQLRKIVPLADTTLYEMERRGDFPRRFAVTRRCVVWDLGEVETCWPSGNAPAGPARGPRARAEPQERSARSR